jgi:hypothetical protein
VPYHKLPENISVKITDIRTLWLKGMKPRPNGVKIGICTDSFKGRLCNFAILNEWWLRFPWNKRLKHCPLACPLLGALPTSGDICGRAI